MILNVIIITIIVIVKLCLPRQDQGSRVEQLGGDTLCLGRVHPLKARARCASTPHIVRIRTTTNQIQSKRRIFISVLRKSTPNYVELARLEPQDTQLTPANWQHGVRTSGTKHLCTHMSTQWHTYAIINTYMQDCRERVRV